MDVRQALVTAVRCCLRGTPTGWPVDALTEQDWEALWALAREQQVLPMVQEQFDRREEARTQMRRIKPLIPAAPPAAEPLPAQS